MGIKHKKSRNAGHRAGLNTVDLIINQCINHKIKFLTLYTFLQKIGKDQKMKLLSLFKLLENFLKKKLIKLLKKILNLKLLVN